MRRLVAYRAAHPVFRRRRWFVGRSIRGSEAHDIAWLRPDGVEMTDEDWAVGYARSMGVYLNGHAIPWPDQRGETVVDDDFLVLFNAGHEPLDWILPGEPWSARWVPVCDTGATPMFAVDPDVLVSGATLTLVPRSVVVLRAEPDGG